MLAEHTSRINTRIPTSTKTRWNSFLLSHNNTIRGSYGPELDRAMNHYMDKFVQPSGDVIPKNITKTKLEKYRLISSRFKDIPTYPIVTPAIISTIIKNCMPGMTRRTLLTYRQVVLDHLRHCSCDDGNQTPKCNVGEFCEFVDKLVNEQFSK